MPGATRDGVEPLIGKIATLACELLRILGAEGKPRSLRLAQTAAEAVVFVAGIGIAIVPTAGHGFQLLVGELETLFLCNRQGFFRRLAGFRLFPLFRRQVLEVHDRASSLNRFDFHNHNTWSAANPSHRKLHSIHRLDTSRGKCDTISPESPYEAYA